MGLLDRFRRQLPAQAPNGQPVVYRHFSQASDPAVLGLSVEELWRTQPYLRTVVTFLARNIAQLGLHTFERVSDTDRQRTKEDPLALLLSRPNPRQTSYELVYSLVADLALYDEAFWWVGEDAEAPSGWSIQPIPPSWVTGRGGGSLFDVAWYDVQPPMAQKPMRVPAEQFLTFHGWNPDELNYGSTPVSALKQILAEQIHAQSYRQQIWERGGRVGAVLTRPATGSEWSEDARKRFSEDWRAKWSGDDGPKAGGTPILEDGMDLKRIGFSAHEDEFVAAAKLSLSMVASVYHVNPTMVGVLENANYSNVREFRRMLYGDTLGPTIAKIEDRVNTFLAPRVTANRSIYVEFNINEKLQGSFEEQTSALQSAVGRPWMAADEARALLNMPSLGGDAAQLVTPLNVLVGGQASPRDSGSQNLASGRTRLKARADETVEAQALRVLSAFFDRQGRVLASLAGAGGLAWDEDRWNKELSGDLFRVNALIATQAGRAALGQLGFDASSWDEDRTLEWLRANAAGVAEGINGRTRTEVEAAVADDSDGDPAAAVRNVFAASVAARARQIASTQVSAISGFGTVEATRQAGVDATKTWSVRSPNPRPAHARMNGETVPVGELFSNRGRWPGDSSLSDDQRAGCTCELVINLP